MKYAKLENGIVTQINVRETEGFVEVPDSVMCGQIKEGDLFVNPPASQQQIERKAAYDAAAAVFNGLSKGKQALWEPVRLAVADAILAGDMASAKETLETVPALYEGAEDDRAMFLALFP